MRNTLLKSALCRVFFPPGSVHPVRYGPLRGLSFRVSPITGFSPWYSGAERFHQAVFKRRVAPGDVVVDVGANWGLHTLYLSRLVGPTGRVVALEPYPPVFGELMWHLQANRCANVTAYPI